MRIGLIADTHMPGSIDRLWPQVFHLFQGVDCILHAGDLHTLDIVDELSRIAPTYVSRGNGDAGLTDERLQDTWFLEFSGISVGMIHHFPSPARKSSQDIFKYVDKHFVERPRLMIYGHTHLEGIHHVEDMICINPGSPTLPRNQSVRFGTVGLLEIDTQAVHSTIFQLADAGAKIHDDVAPIKILHHSDGEHSLIPSYTQGSSNLHID